MPQPPTAQVHISRPLTNISVAYVQRQDMFIAGKVFPVVPVQKQYDQYFTFTKSYWFRTDVQKRAPGTESAGSGYELGTATYNADVYAVHKDVDDQIRANSDSPLQPDIEATEFVTQQMLQKRDQDWVTAFFGTSLWTGSSSGSDITPATTWDDDASTPIEDIRAQKRSILEKTGVSPNEMVLVCGAKCFDDLIDHPDILDRIKHGAGPGNPAVANEAAFARVLGVGRVLVSLATKNTAAEAATATMDFITSERNALLVWAPPSAGLRTPTGGATFTWTGYLGGNAGAPQISRFRMANIRADRVEAEMAYDMKVVAADVGAFFSNPVAA